MADETREISLDQRRLALEERKWADEIALRRAELDAKARDSSWSAKLFSPLTATLLAGIATVAGSVSATLIQNSHSLRLETEKAQHELILKMVTGTDEAQARKNLAFLAEVGLVDPDTAKKIVAAKTVPVVPAPGRFGSTALPPAPEELRRLLSDDAMEAILASEVGSKQSYEAKLVHPSWPGGAAGLNIGIGYDLGLVTLDQFAADWKSRLPEADFDALKAAVGITGPAAAGLAQNLAKVSISWENAVTVYYSELRKWSAILDRALPNVRELPPESYGALVSLTYNRGPAFDRQGDRYVEMRKIRELMEARQFSEVPAQIRSMQRLWPTLAGIRARREQEAKLFEKGLAAHSPAPRAQ